MKDIKNLIKAVVLFAGFLLSTSTFAFTINGATDVGEVDNLVAMTALPDFTVATETAWVESVLGLNVTLDFRDRSELEWTAVDGQVAGSETVYAQSLDTNPDYYLLRLINGGVNGNDTILYENIASLAYAVIDLVALGQGSTIDIYSVTVSHINEFSVPEPGPIALLGFGLLGLIVARKKAKSA